MERTLLPSSRESGALYIVIAIIITITNSKSSIVFFKHLHSNEIHYDTSCRVTRTQNRLEYHRTNPVILWQMLNSGCAGNLVESRAILCGDFFVVFLVSTHIGCYKPPVQCERIIIHKSGSAEMQLSVNLPKVAPQCHVILTTIICSCCYAVEHFFCISTVHCKPGLTVCPHSSELCTIKSSNE